MALTDFFSEGFMNSLGDKYNATVQEGVQRVVGLARARLGIASDRRDEYILFITLGVYEELSQVQGLELSFDNLQHLMFMTDLVAWRYENRDVQDGLPEHLHFRLRNLIVEGVRREKPGD